jgi:hypothetical protein
MKIRFIVVILIFAFSAGLVADDEKTALSPAETITMAELRDHMFYLASDELGGRIWNKPGYKLAVDYAVSQFRAAGIKPLLKDAEGNPTFLQKVIIQETSFVDATRWTLTVNDKTHEFKAGAGIKTGQPGSLINSQTGNFYFLGYGIAEPDHGWDDVKELDLSDKTVVVTVGTPQKDGKPVLPEDINKKYDGLRGLGYKLDTLKKLGASRIVLLSGGELDKLWQNIFDVLLAKRQSVGKKKKAKDNNPFTVILNQETGKLLFEGRDYSPYSDSEAGYKTFPLDGVTLKLKAEKQIKEAYTWNVVGFIPGTDTKLKDEYVVLGAHLDHIPPVDGKVCNGADDNASGSIAVIESGEALVQEKNKRSIILCLWGAEEIGLFGSQFFVDNSPVELAKIKAHVNLDMIARTDKKNEKDRAIYALGMDSGSPAFKEFVEKVNADSVNWPLNTERSRFGDASDHAAFKANGIPVVFFFSGPHKDYHRPTDDPENLDWEKFLNVSRLACNLTQSLANTDIDLGSFRK